MFFLFGRRGEKREARSRRGSKEKCFKCFQFINYRFKLREDDEMNRRGSVKTAAAAANVKKCGTCRIY